MDTMPAVPPDSLGNDAIKTEKEKKRLSLHQWSGMISLAVLYFVSRIPLIYAGFGSDNDSLLYGGAAKTILETGSYALSRKPGFPLYEQLVALFLRFDGWVLINWMTAIISLLAIYVFYHIMTFYKYTEQEKIFLCVFLAVFHTFWISSASVIDYNWALFLILSAYLALLYNRWELSALCLAMAIGFRLPSGIMGAPYLIYLYKKAEMRRYLLPYFLLTGLMSFIFYAPCFFLHGLDFLRPAIFTALSPLFYIVGYCRWIYKLLGLIPGFFLGLGLIIYLPRLKEYLFSKEIEHQMNLFIVGLGFLAFFAFPAQTEYLLPIIPFTLCILIRIFSKRYMIFLLILFLSHNFICLSIYDSTEKKPEFAFRSGALLSDIKERKYLLEYPEILASISFPDKSLVFTLGVPLSFAREKEPLFEGGDFEIEGEVIEVGRKIGSDKDVLYLTGVAFIHPRIEEFMDAVSKRNYHIYIQRELYGMYRVGVLFRSLGIKVPEVVFKEEWDVKVFDSIRDSTW